MDKGGIVVGNVFSGSSNRYYDSMVRTYQDVFEQLYILDVRGAGNEIFLALPRAREITHDKLALRAAAISKRKNLPIDLGDIVAYGFQGIEEPNTTGRVLRDKKQAK